MNKCIELLGGWLSIALSVVLMIMLLYHPALRADDTNSADKPTKEQYCFHYANVMRRLYIKNKYEKCMSHD